MANKIQPKIYKINLLLLLALCIGLSRPLYAAQNDELDDEKEYIAGNGQKVEQPLPQQSNAYSKDSAAYLEYIENFGYAPKLAKHLIAFSKQIGTPISWKKATHILKHPPTFPEKVSNNQEKIVFSWANLHENKHQDEQQDDCNVKGAAKNSQQSKPIVSAQKYQHLEKEYTNIYGKYKNILRGGDNHIYKINKRPKDASSDDEKDEFKNASDETWENKKQIVASWPCPQCTFLNKANSKSCAICYTDKRPLIEDQHASWGCAVCTFMNKATSKSCAMCYNPKLPSAEEEIGPWTCAVCTLKNPIYNKKCGTCKTPHPLLLQHMPPKHDQNKLVADRSIGVKFLRYESENDNNNKPVVAYRFKVMYNNSACEMTHTYASLHKIHKWIIRDEKKLVFPSKSISANYLQCGNELQRYLLSLFKHDKTDDEEILLDLGLWICDICKLLNDINKKCSKCKSERLTITIKWCIDREFSLLLISIAYAKDISLNDVLDKAIQYINNRYEQQYHIICIGDYGSFIENSVNNQITSTDNHEWDALVKQKITTWDRDKIIKKGLKLRIRNIYHHSPKQSKISCPYIKDADPSKYSGLDLALQCPIYRDAKEHYKVSKDALRHLHFFSHFLDEYNEKAVCKYGAGCNSFVRLENNSNSVKDLSHIKLYRHPPRRNRQIQLGENIHQFVCHQNENDNPPLYKPTDTEKKNLLRLLLDEVIKHGYKYDLCLICKKNNKCKHDVYHKNKNSLTSVIEGKFNHPRYKKMGYPFRYKYSKDYTYALMLSLLLYTGGDCNYNLCKSQRNGDYDKWKVFDYCLWHAIDGLSENEYGTYELYSGLQNTKLSKKNIMSGYFPTYTSTTLYKEIAEDFMENKGMMIEIDPAVRNHFVCCDVSWISKFPDEHEIVVARTIKEKLGKNKNAFSVKILDEKKDVQTILLTTNHGDVIPKIACMLRAAYPSHKVTASDKSTFNKLISDAKDVPADTKKRWNKLRHQQQCITIDMGKMYQYYKAFMPLLFDLKLQHLLLFDKIAQLFPNVTEIICARIDFDIDKTEKSDYYEYSSAIVCSSFILGVKERLTKIDKHAKLTKIIIQTEKKEIANNCKLYAPQFGALGWKIGKVCHSKTIVVTKEPYDGMYKDVIPKISAMIEGKEPSYHVPPSLDVPVFKQLILGAKDVPADVQKQWDKLRHQQQRITIDIKYMHYSYKAFIPLLFDPKRKNLLLLDTIAQLFPNVTEIICESTDYSGVCHTTIHGNTTIYRYYSSAIVRSNFILGVKERLTKMAKHAKLTKIVIETKENEIAADCKLYATQFETFGWQIGKGGKTIVVTKESYKVICKEAIAKISSMVQGGRSSYEATSLDAPVFKKLINQDKDVPADVQKQWDKLRHQQQSITIDMEYMYAYYKAFMPLLFDLKIKNLLLLDKIAQLFPNVTEIIYRETDCIKVDKWKDGKYSSGIVCSNFILGLKERLSKMDKHAKLTKIIIQTYKYEIKDGCKLYAIQFGALGWKIEKGSYENKYKYNAQKNNQITLTKKSGASR